MLSIVLFMFKYYFLHFFIYKKVFIFIFLHFYVPLLCILCVENQESIISFFLYILLTLRLWLMLLDLTKMSWDQPRSIGDMK